MVVVDVWSADAVIALPLEWDAACRKPAAVEPSAWPVQADEPADLGARQLAYAHTAVESECRKLARSPEGRRNTQLFTSTLKLWRFVTVVGQQALVDALVAAAAKAGLPSVEAHQAIVNAVRYGGNAMGNNLYGAVADDVERLKRGTFINIGKEGSVQGVVTSQFYGASVVYSQEEKSYSLSDAKEARYRVAVSFWTPGKGVRVLQGPRSLVEGFMLLSKKGVDVEKSLVDVSREGTGFATTWSVTHVRPLTADELEQLKALQPFDWTKVDWVVALQERQAMAATDDDVGF